MFVFGVIFQSECVKIRIRVTHRTTHRVTETFYFLPFTFPSLIDVPFYLAFPTGIVKYRLGRLSKMDIYVIFILILLVPLFRSLVFKVVYFSMSQYIGDTTLFRVTIIKQTCKREKQFSRWQRV